MKVLVALLTYLSSTLVVAEECDVFFTTDQLHTLQRAFDAGQERDWGWSLAAISWRESSAGLELVRFEPPFKAENASYGPFHVYLKTAMSREGCVDYACAADITQDLITDFQYSADHAMAELDYWMSVHGRDYLKIWKGYNDGFQNTQKGADYAEEIRGKIRYLKECINLENH